MLKHALTLNNLCPISGGYQRSLDISEVQELRSFLKRLKKEELQKVNKRFQPMLQAAGVQYEVQPQTQLPPMLERKTFMYLITT